MKNIKLVLASMLAAMIVSPISAQIGYTERQEEVVDNDDLFAPFKTVYRSDRVEFVDHKDDNQIGSILLHRQKMVHQAMNGGLEPYSVKKIGSKGVVTTTKDASTVRTTSPKGKSIQQKNMESKARQVQRQAAFAEKRRQERLAAARRAAAIEAERKRREREADDKRAAQAEAQANARLQGRTNANIQRDYYNAGEGRQQARQTVTNAANAAMKGPQYIATVSPKTTGATYANNLRENRNRARQRNVSVPSRPVDRIIRLIPENNFYTIIARSNKTSIHIKKDPRFSSPNKPNAPKTLKANQGFVLSPNAVVTTGRNKEYENPWIFKNPRQIPPPVTRINQKAPTDNEMMDLKLKEFFPDEKS